VNRRLALGVPTVALVDPVFYDWSSVVSAIERVSRGPFVSEAPFEVP